MFIGLKVTSNLLKVQEELKRRWGEEYAKRILEAATIAAEAIRREVDDWTGRTSTIKTGKLSRSFTPKIWTKFDASGSRAAAGAYSNSKYAGIHDTGGPITAKGGALTIPITPEARGKRARDWGDKLFIVRKKGHLPILASKDGDGIKPQYILKKRVYISGKNYIAKAADACRDDVRQALEAAVEEAINGAGAGPKKAG